MRVACFATLGSGSHEEGRIISLLGEFNPEVWPFDRSAKAASGRALVRRGRETRPDMVVIEGSGLAGGLACMALERSGIPYLVSSGDAIAPYLRTYHRAFAAPALAYETMLYRRSAGFIGWTPYLVGRALTLGAPRGVTAAFWGDPVGDQAGVEWREKLGISPEAIVFGIAGALNWDKRGYCYGWELVRALVDVQRDDIHVLIVGDGDGLPKLQELGANEIGRRLTFAGRVRRDEVTPVLSAMDVGSLPQTMDGVGSFRYTTKISEYVVARLPTVTAQIPAAYDLNDGWMWRLPGDTPWGATYISAMTELMETITRDEIEARRRLIPPSIDVFDPNLQRRRVTAFVEEALDAWRRRDSIASA